MPWYMYKVSSNSNKHFCYVAIVELPVHTSAYIDIFVNSDNKLICQHIVTLFLETRIVISTF